MGGGGGGKFPDASSGGKCDLFIDDDGSDRFGSRGFICYGNGRSYGDSALYKDIVCTRGQDLFIGFEPRDNILEVQGGCMLSEIVDFAIAKGLFLKVTPGTKFVTLGGAIAFDVHGKNHHVQGCFSSCVKEIKLLMPDGIHTVKPGDFLFRATCGGAGLTGIILSAKIQLMSLRSSYINKHSMKLKTLDELLEAFETHSQQAYSVAWIDCLSERSIFDYGCHADDDDLWPPSRSTLTLPCYAPEFVMSPLSIRIFNELHYASQLRKVQCSRVDIDRFFYPLDSVLEWNRIYGRRGFVQYQFITPDELGLRRVLEAIRQARASSPISVLKKHGPSNGNLLSFPIQGYSLALDFRVSTENLKLMDRLDDIVVEHGGRVYLAKDARLPREKFDMMYPGVADEFRRFRAASGLNKYMKSYQSQRLGL